jgi:hypothetical protein
MTIRYTVIFEPEDKAVSTFTAPRFPVVIRLEIPRKRR